MRNSAITLVLISVTVAGCSIRHCYWYNPAKTLEEAKRDCRECYNEAVAEYYYDHAAPLGWFYHFRRGIAGSEADYNALDGWIMWGDSYRQNVFRGCMKRRAYFRVRADQLGESVRKRSLYMDNVAGR